MGADEETETSLREDQHPALRGEPEVEVAQRAADGSSGTTLRKVFVVAAPEDVQDDSIPDDHPMHEANCVRTLEEAIQRGLHPKAKARLVSSEVVERPGRGPASVALTYEVEVQPAVIDTEAHETVTPSSEIEERDRGRTA